MGELARLQKAFTEHLRNPDVVPVPEGLDPRRVGVYSELIFNNLSSLLTEFFPVIKSIVGEDRWLQLVRDFFISHQAETPYFPRLSEEFVHFLAGRQIGADEPPFLLELAHYEWIELHLYWHHDDPPAEPLSEETLLDGPIRLSKVAEPLGYQYPVHRIGPEFQPTRAPDQATFLLVFRDPDDSVHFFELQPFTFQFMESLQEHPGLVPNEWLAATADTLGVADVEAFLSSGRDMLKQFNARCVFEAAG